MNVGILVPGESDEPDLARLLSIDERAVGDLLVENAMRIFIAEDLVMLDEIDPVGLQSAQRLVQLPRRRFPRPAVDLCHDERLLPVAVTESSPHPPLAGTQVIVPAVIEEIDASIDGGPHDSNG